MENHRGDAGEPVPKRLGCWNGHADDTQKGLPRLSILSSVENKEREGGNMIINLLKRPYYFSAISIALCLFAFICLGLTVSSSEAQQPSITITEAVWTNGVNGSKNPKAVFEDIADGARQIYLWTKIQGEEEALSYLSKNGKLPIRHQWFSYVGATPLPEDIVTPTDEIVLHVGKSEETSKLQGMLKEKGYFQWRTWSMKKNLYEGWWKVRVVYNDGEPVLCEDEPCQFVIEIR
jgi:hypothetical protein